MTEDTVWLTLEEAADYLRISKPSAYRFMQEGSLPYYRIAGTGLRRFRREDLDAMMLPGTIAAPRSTRGKAKTRTSENGSAPAAQRSA